MSPTHSARSSLSPEGPNSAGKSKEGRTPPPAPSAAFARRAREIIEDETGLPISRPAGVSPTPEEEVDGTPGGVSSGYRRARAGTMPSKLEEPFSHALAAEESSPPSPAPSSAVNLTTPARPSAPTLVYPHTTSAARPTLRHALSSAANLETPTANRNRSGSLTLPPNNLGQAFGRDPFSNAWLNNPGPARSPLGQPSENEDPMSLTSPSDTAASLQTDDLNFSTLDYLGLADGSDLPPASMSELRTQAQRAIASSGPASRLRASTVSNFNRPSPLRPSITNNNLYPHDRNPYGQSGEDDALAREIANMGLYEPTHTITQLANLYNPSHLYKDTNRPRATTIGALDKPARRSDSRGYLAAIPQSPVPGHLGNAYNTNAQYGYPPRSRSDRDLTRSRESSSSRGPRLSMSSHTSRTGTPDIERGSSTPQVPTRSLWIGNLDVNATSDALLHVFAPYGAIESVRMLPEKTCAFVNFMDKADAIRARDDVLNRLGGHVPSLAETAPVRIGFGKIDSAPSNPPMSSIPAPPSSGLVFTNGTPQAVTVPPQAGDSALNLSPDQGQETSSQPTRAVWIGSIPGTTSSATLLQIFSPFGPVESARVLMHKCCGFINFEHLDSAVSARNALNGKDILGSDVGPIRIGFARVQTRSPTIGGPENESAPDSAHHTTIGELSEGLSTVGGAEAVSTERQFSVEGGGLENYRSQLVVDLVKQGVHEQVLEKGFGKGGVVSETQMIMQVLSAGREAEDGDVRAAADNRPPTTYYTSIPIITDRQMRRFDATKLKELRRKLDAGQMAQAEVDAISTELMEDTAELSSDYIGNTIIQKLFERASPDLRFEMLQRVVPHLALIGIHKNGTWAAQKIIECSVTPAERQLVIDHLKPFAPPLMCDSLGNYVCAGTLRFGAPWNDYVFDAMVDRMWDIAQNRFGARCMRTCLESPHTSLYQRKRISTSIILNSIPLATNPNGALLLTWLVDSSNLPGRYGLLATRFAPHIAHLCTHKLASLTVLRVITQTAEPTASSLLVSSIFSSTSDQTLIEILGDANNGSQVIGKIIAISTLPQTERDMMLEAVRRVLPNIKASATPPYRMLLEAVGLPVPAGLSPFRQPTWNSAQASPTSQGYPMQGGYYHNPYQQASPGYPANLSPLLIPQNMPLGQAMRAGSPNLSGSPITPQARHRGRMSPASHMMSPGSDPFNPFASPSIDLPYPQSRLSAGMVPTAMRFEQQPPAGGLGIMGQQGQGGNAGTGNNSGPGVYYQQNMVSYRSSSLSLLPHSSTHYPLHQLPVTASANKSQY
ncbi:hypothetical protein BCR39DRAFT_473742 [Naematelia encephala]|uniref:Pumilio domain-containing protein c n=1 Tax=Naematelia encephala TaxID=71784 RepID=A0A1Y2AJE1_9TREE|nr:hypothetical protein BCR39DRAFT_473742 [Naematelia encephala]